MRKYLVYHAVIYPSRENSSNGNFVSVVVSSLFSARKFRLPGDIDDGMRDGLMSVVKLPGTQVSGLCDADNSRGRRRGPRRQIANTQEELVDFYAGLTNVWHENSAGKFVDAP